MSTTRPRPAKPAAEPPRLATLNVAYAAFLGVIAGPFAYLYTRQWGRFAAGMALFVVGVGWLTTAMVQRLNPMIEAASGDLSQLPDMATLTASVAPLVGPATVLVLLLSVGVAADCARSIRRARQGAGQ